MRKTIVQLIRNILFNFKMLVCKIQFGDALFRQYIFFRSLIKRKINASELLFLFDLTKREKTLRRKLHF